MLDTETSALSNRKTENQKDKHGSNFKSFVGEKKLRSYTHCKKQHEPTQYLASGWWRKICPGLHHSARACQQKQVALSKLWGMTAALPAHRNALCCTECQGNEWVSEAREERRKHCLENKWDICTQVCEPVWCQRPLVLRNISSSKRLAREKILFPPWLAGHQSEGCTTLRRVAWQRLSQDYRMAVAHPSPSPCNKDCYTERL